MAAEGTSSTTGRSLLQSVLVSAVDSYHCCGCHPRAPKPISVSCVCRGAEARITFITEVVFKTGNSHHEVCERVKYIHTFVALRYFTFGGI